jgi:hypothetical protein
VEITCILCDNFDRVQALVSQAINITSLKYIIVTEDIPQSYKSKGIYLSLLYKIFEIYFIIH